MAGPEGRKAIAERIETLTLEAADRLAAGDGDGAAARLKAALALAPESPAARRNLAHLYRSTGHYRKALAAYRAVAEIDEASIIRVEIANCLVNIGEPAEGLEALRRLLATPQGRKAGASAYLMARLYDPDATPADIRAEHEALTAAWRVIPRAAPDGAGDDRRPLRVGYLTSDLSGDHPVAQFLAPVLAAHRDPAHGVASVVFNARPGRDDTARRLGAIADIRTVDGLDDEAAAARIAAEKIDLLIDLSGHTSGRRLSVLGLRPAPAQACYIGYPATTGFAGVDWLIGDGVLFPHGADEFYTERLARLDSWLAFTPPPSMPAPSPERRPGPVVFGSLNHLPKLNGAVLDLWARILKATPGSVLLLKCAAFAEAETVEAVAERLLRRGVSGDRLRLKPPSPFAEAMGVYREIDIALDPFPYNGGTTTAHALYMGAPVVSLEGGYFCGRMGASLLAAAGRPEWIARSPDAYVGLACALADRIAAGEPVRATLLETNAKARLFDINTHAARLADLYRTIAAED